MKDPMNTVSEIKVEWNLNENGCLVVKGRVPDCEGAVNPPAPWQDVKDQILEVVIEEGIEKIGLNAFRDCINLEKVFLPTSLKRIYSYAFYGCTKLSAIHTYKQFHYIYDESEYDQDHTILFGLDTFCNTPWAELKFPDFYIKDNQLYFTLTHSKNIVIPEGVKVLKSYSLSYLDVDSILLPSTLEVIEDFAFLRTTVKKEMILPESVLQLTDYSLHDCVIHWVENPLLIEFIEGNQKDFKDQKGRFPKVFYQFGVASQATKLSDKFKRIKISRKSPPKGNSCLLRNTVNAARYIINKLKKGEIILCLEYDERKRIISVKSFAKNMENNLIMVYLMYPTVDDDEDVGIWSDSLTYFQTVEVEYAFEDEDGLLLQNRGSIRYPDSDEQEVWFCSKDRGNFYGPLELSLLWDWLKFNPNFTVDSIKENREKQLYRFFVRI